MKIEISLPDEVVAKIDVIGNRSEFITGAVIRMLAEIGRRTAHSEAQDDEGPEFQAT